MSRSARVEVDTRSWGEEGGWYSDDQRYRWSYSWPIGTGPTIVWVGLNPGTGDKEGRYRPTSQSCFVRFYSAVGLPILQPDRFEDLLE
jgi:hypothetical protein